MADERRPRVFSERLGRWILNLYPVLILQGIWIREIGPGFRSLKVRLRRSLLNRNINGTTFGGAIFSAGDPFYAVMYWQIFARLGIRVRVWLKTARIEFKKPTHTALDLEFSLSDAEIARAHQELQREGRFARSYETRAVDANGEVCALITTEVHVKIPQTEAAVSETKEAADRGGRL